MPGPSCTSRRTKKKLNPRRSRTTGGVQQQQLLEPSGVQSGHPAHWSAETPSSSRHHRAYSRQRRKKLHSRLFRRATAWTTKTASQTTTFCVIFATTLPRWNLFPLGLLTTSPWAGSQTIHRWLNSWRGSARSPGETLDGGATGPLQEGAMPGGKPTDGVSQEGVLEPQEQPGSPTVTSLGTPLAGSQPLQQRGHSRLEVTPAVTRAGTASKSFVRRNANNCSDSAHLSAITTGSALSEVRGLMLSTKKILPDIAHERYGADSAIKYAYAATVLQRCSVGKNAEIIPNTFREAMTLPANDVAKRQSGLKNWSVCTPLLTPRTRI